MNRIDEWKYFIEQLQDTAIKEYRKTREYELKSIRQEHLEEMMSNELTDDQKTFVEEIIYEIISFHDREADILYQQGMKDCVWMLKTLGVIA